MPDFVVKQQIQRSVGYAGTGNFRNQDRLVVGARIVRRGRNLKSFCRSTVLSQQNAEAKGSYEEAGGSSSTGEFGTTLATIFKPEK